MPRWPTRTLAQRFWSKVDRSGGYDACWPWRGAVNPLHGYGQFRYGGRIVRAHRMALALAGVSLDDGQDALHECDNRLCCNGYNQVSHVRPGTRAENNRDIYVRGRRIKLKEARALKVAG